MRHFVCFLALVCIVAAVPVYGDSDLTLFGAAQRQGKLTVQTASSAASTTRTFDPATFGTFGIRGGHARVFGSEHTFAYSPNFIESKTKAVILNSNILIQAPVPKIKPYGTAGIGTIFTWGSDDGRPSIGKIGTKFALNYGGGVKVFAAGPIGLRFDIRGYAIPGAKFNIPVPTATDPLATVKSQSETLNLLEVGFGIIFSLGR
jgi:hypothetical protein